MTNIKSRGFRTKAEFDAHLRELDDDAPAEDPQFAPAADDLSSARAQVSALRAEVAGLREQFRSIRTRTDDVGVGLPWLRIGIAFAAPFVLGNFLLRPSLGARIAAAVPKIAKQIGRRFR